MDVDPINGERLEAGDLQLTLRHRLLCELKLSVQRLCTTTAAAAAAAAVAVSLDRRGSAAVEGKPVVAPPRSVGYTKHIPPASIRRPGRQRQKPEVGKEAQNDIRTQLQPPWQQLQWFSSERTES